VYSGIKLAVTIGMLADLRFISAEFFVKHSRLFCDSPHFVLKICDFFFSYLCLLFVVFESTLTNMRVLIGFELCCEFTINFQQLVYATLKFRVI
jgi:hypothetical protein